MAHFVNYSVVPAAESLEQRAAARAAPVCVRHRSQRLETTHLALCMTPKRKAVLVGSKTRRAADFEQRAPPLVQEGSK